MKTQQFVVTPAAGKRLIATAIARHEAVVSALQGGTAAQNAAILRGVLDGEPGPARDVVLLNAAAALVVAGLASDLAGGLEQARESLDSRRARRALEALVRVSNG